MLGASYPSSKGTIIAALVGLINILASPVAGAQTHGAAQTGNGFLQSCSRNAAGTFQAGCVSYFSGIADTLVGIELTKSDSERQICFPSGIVYGQMMDITLNYLRANPSIRHLSTPNLVYLALRESFPCRR